MSSKTNDPCPPEDVLLDVLAGDVALAGSPALVRHLAGCPACRAALAELARDGSPSPDAHAGEAGSGASLLADRYRLIRLVGAGGMGAVWEAEDTRTGAHVAVKVLRFLGEASLRRQRREARIAAALRHPNIVPVLDVVDDDDARGPALVMPLLEGETLETRLARERRLPLRAAAAVLVPFLDALAFAHARGIVHRDVKPQNVYLTHEDVRVLDFGIAKDEADVAGSRITRTGEVLGTPRYMAPEQIFGEPDVDARADVWAAGVVTYRVLSGEMPIAARTLAETIKAHARGALVPLAAHAQALGIPDALTAAVDACLVRDRAARTTKPSDLRDALAAAARHVPP